jgi:hypothetical protein
MTITKHGEYDIVAYTAGAGVLIRSEPPRLSAKELQDIIDPLLAAWPAVKLTRYDGYVGCVGLQFSRPTDEEAGTFSFANTGVYATCTGGEYRLHRVEVQ